MYSNWQIRDRRFRPPIKNYEGGNFQHVHLKRDGHMIRLEITVKDDEVDWCAYTRRPTDISWSVYSCWKGLSEVLIKGLLANSPKGKWILLGEMYYPGKPASYVKTGFKNQDTSLRIEFFAIVETPWATVSELADISIPEVEEICRSYSIPFVPYISYLEYMEGGIPWFKDRDCEGFVVKQGNLTGWQKWKKKKTIDLVCTGFTEGEGKYRGQIGSLCGSIQGIEVATVSGMTDKERIRISCNQLIYEGRVFECEYQLVGSNGRLRHPVFKGWRTDKFAHECLLDQDSGLENHWGQKNV